VISNFTEVFIFSYLLSFELNIYIVVSFTHIAVMSVIVNTF